MRVTGFFSYAHDDDSFGLLTDLHRDLCAEFKRVSGSELDLFIDRRSIKWGERWQEAIDRGIDSAAFFIPALSPLYLQSPACQQEMRQYLDIVQRIDAKELFMPLLITDIGRDGLELDEDLVKQVLEYQYYDARELNSLDRGSGRYREMTREIATKLFDANMQLSKKSVASVVTRGSVSSSEKREDPENSEESEADTFFLDSMSEFEPKANEMVAMLGAIGADMEKLGEIAASKAPELESAGKSPNAAREMIAVTASLADELTPAANLFEQHAKDYQRQANELDLHVRTMLEAVRDTGVNNGEVNRFMGSLKDAASAADETKQTLEGFGNQVGPLQKVSRVLYKPMRTIERAVSLCIGALNVSIAWGELVLGENSEIAEQGE